MHDDPGWRSAWKGIALGPLLGVAPSLLRRVGGGDGLVVLRMLFLSFVGSMAVFGVVLAILYPSWADDPSTGLLAVVVAAGVACVVAAVVVARRPLGPASTPKELAGAYRTRFFLGLALAQTPGLVGFVLAFTVRGVGPYVVGLVFSAAAFVLAAPTRAHLERDQQALATRGSSLDLVAALRGEPDLAGGAGPR